MANKISIYGARFHTSMYKEDIEELVQNMYDYVYRDNKVVFEYNLVEPDEVQLSWKRKANYAIKGDFISDEDMEMVTNLPLQYFLPEPLGNPVIMPLMPMGKNYYVPAQSFAEFYKGLQQFYGVSIKDVLVTANDSEVTVIIKYA